MKYDTMNEYALQSYFKSLCNSYMIAYSQVKRLEEEKEELGKDFPREELSLVENLLELSKLSTSATLKEKYVEQKFSQEELEKRKEALKIQKEIYETEKEKIERQLKFWSDKMWDKVENIIALLYRIRAEGFSIIITSEAEIVALMAVFRRESNGMKEFASIINTNEEYLRSFPTSGLCLSFLRAYGLKNEEEMEKVIEKYF